MTTLLVAFSVLSLRQDYRYCGLRWQCERLWWKFWVKHLGGIRSVLLIITYISCISSHSLSFLLQFVWCFQNFCSQKNLYKKPNNNTPLCSKLPHPILLKLVILNDALYFQHPNNHHTMKFTIVFLAALLFVSVLAQSCPCTSTTNKTEADSQCSGLSGCSVIPCPKGEYTCCSAKKTTGRQMVLKDMSSRANMPAESHGYYYCRTACVCCSGLCSCWRLCRYCS